MQQKDSKIVIVDTSVPRVPCEEPQKPVDQGANDSNPANLESSNGKRRKENSSGNKTSAMIEPKAKNVSTASNVVRVKKESNKSNSIAGKVEPTPTRNKENEDAVLQEVERYVDESARKATTPTEPPQSSSILDWVSKHTQFSVSVC